MRTLPSLALLLVLLALTGCAAGPEATWDRALQARRDKDRAAYLACFTTKTQKVLQNLDAFQATAKKDLQWLKDPYTLLPEASPTGAPKVDGNVALLRVGSGKKEIEAVLVREAGQWRIEGLELPSFWAPLASGKENE